ncbi:MAG: tRNA (guanosine(37)-N1)-methyltransferase TrmD [Nitrospinota bacterium]
MHFEVVTIFPAMFEIVKDFSIINRGIKKNLLTITPHNLRDYTDDKHKTTDDAPFGGGAGMLMKVEPFYRAIKLIKSNPKSAKNPKVVLMTPQGEKLDQPMVRKLALEDQIIILTGRYEGVDERVRHLVDQEISIGDYILTGGELAAMVLIDTVARLQEGLLGDEHSSEDESFNDSLLEYPHYTRPAEFKGMKTPSVLLSGDHTKIKEWRRYESIVRTATRRPDLIEKADLSTSELAIARNIIEKSKQ